MAKDGTKIEIKEIYLLKKRVLSSPLCHYLSLSIYLYIPIFNFLYLFIYLSLCLSIFLSVAPALSRGGKYTSESKHIVVRCNEELYFFLNLSFSLILSISLRLSCNDQFGDYSDNNHAQLELYRSGTGMRNT